MAETIIIYGNCQVGMIAAQLNYLFREQTTSRPVRFVGAINFPNPATGQRAWSEEGLQEASWVWEQYDSTHSFPHKADVPRDCRYVKFPPLDFNLPWPFAAKDP